MLSKFLTYSKSLKNNYHKVLIQDKNSQMRQYNFCNTAVRMIKCLDTADKVLRLVHLHNTIIQLQGSAAVLLNNDILISADAFTKLLFTKRVQNS